MTVCQHFGPCGGCLFQDLSPKEYQDHKKQLVQKALENCNLGHIGIRDPIILPARKRRRCNLKVLKTKDKVILGYHARKSHEIIHIAECPLILSELETRLPLVRRMLELLLLPKQKAEVFMAWSDVGLDLLIVSDNWRPLDLNSHEALIQLARDHDLARVMLATKEYREELITFRNPVIHYGGIPVDMDADAFMQASSASNDILTDLVMNGAPERMKRAADLFCGRGTFSLPLSTLTKVDSYELDKLALSALERAKNKHSRPINTFVRNLFQEALTKDELDKYDYVVINPPRAGALKQCYQLAETSVPTITMVSCEPQTFARDAQVLIAGGYRLNEVTPVDQFLWSDHIEVVGTFRR